MQKFQFSRPPVSSQQKNHRKSSVTEKILQKKISCTCLDCSEIVLWEPSGQNHSILPAQVASHSLDSGSTWGARPFLELEASNSRSLTRSLSHEINLAGLLSSLRNRIFPEEVQIYLKFRSYQALRQSANSSLFLCVRDLLFINSWKTKISRCNAIELFLGLEKFIPNIPTNKLYNDRRNS